MKANNPDIEPIAILVHPQQPLSHLERLIQSELPPLKTADNQSRPPTVSFIALQLSDDPIRPKRTVYKDQQLPTEGDTYTYLRDTPSAPNTKKSKDNHRLVRWSQSTEIGDFIRDAARAREFIVSVEQAPAPVSASDNSHSNDNNNNDTPLHQIRIAVPSFDERTYFLRMRLRKISGRIKSIAEIKHECDALAHRGAQRVAIGGFGVLSLWWYLVYKLTFETDLGWDTMEPVTYLVSLSTLMGGYLWFLYHNREISYRSALDFTINARQKKLYQAKGVDLHLWETLIDEGNTLRREIKTIAAEYDVEWDEMLDERDESVTQALKEERTQKNGSKRARDDDDERARDDD
ncbi:hypothetical protein BO70DRAFT_200750 [Aspergillus heteromorphus CBS 117.55]|uniref:Calcium uniporter protein n=1 Tax=Aspergillus heteromorphus CBS 117.55 TaxID=1448321 RepID=A0A317WR04_9EURO|nr:uncharacterized protein BO70DRAFT_200750 [Aspergillus heteromorphus CBS 117.55]PWY87702.1 hypothetical protein BO70DRAFT_200750 [Aspergillus heteromorphus CBS 117.55]